MYSNLLARCLSPAGQLDVDKLLAGHREAFGHTRMDENDDASSDDADQDADESDDTDEDDDSSDDDESGEDKKLGEAGQRALDRMKADRKADREALRKARAEIARLKADGSKGKTSKNGKADDEPDVEEIRRAAKEEADAQVLTVRVADKIEAKAGARFNIDPEDVAAMLLRPGRNTVEDFLDSNGRIDVNQINEALDELLEDNPGLAAQADPKRRPKGSADQGRRKDAKPKAKSLQDAVTARYKP